MAACTGAVLNLNHIETEGRTYSRANVVRASANIENVSDRPCALAAPMSAQARILGPDGRFLSYALVWFGELATGVVFGPGDQRSVEINWYEQICPGADPPPPAPPAADVYFGDCPLAPLGDYVLEVSWPPAGTAQTAFQILWG